MRVVAGSMGGRRLATPGGDATRPTSDLVRGAIFNSLSAQGVLEGAVVVDLFAGSGALGIEAVSRGATSVVFVERNRATAGVIKGNLAALGIGPQARVEVVDVLAWADRGGRGPVDLVLADPPYSFDQWERLLAALVTFPTALVVAESDREIAAVGWDVRSVKRHGGTVVSQLSPRGAR